MLTSAVCLVWRDKQARRVQEELKAQASGGGGTYIVLPSHPYKRAWDMFIIFLVLYNALVLPLDVGFAVQTGPGWCVVD